jgi:peptidyl-dipeptidase A
VRTSKLFLLIVLAAACESKTKSSERRRRRRQRPTSAPDPAADKALIAEAKQFTTKVDQELRKLYVDASVTDWANQTDITKEHEDAAAKAAEALANGLTKLIKESRKFERVQEKLDPDTRRQLWLLKIAGQPAPDDPKQAEELAKIAAEMTSTYGKGKVCDASKPKPGAPTQKALDDLTAKVKAEADEKKKADGEKQLAEQQKKFDEAYCKDLDALSKVLQKSRKPAELLAVWQGWHDNVGKAIRPMFTRYVELANAGARGVGFKDVAEMWKSGYDMPADKFEPESIGCGIRSVRSTSISIATRAAASTRSTATAVVRRPVRFRATLPATCGRRHGATSTRTSSRTQVSRRSTSRRRSRRSSITSRWCRWPRRSTRRSA